jgi:hypothetical protein
MSKQNLLNSIKIRAHSSQARKQMLWEAQCPPQPVTSESKIASTLTKKNYASQDRRGLAYDAHPATSICRFVCWATMVMAWETSSGTA